MFSSNELTNATSNIDTDKQVTNVGFSEHEDNIKRELNNELE